MKHRHGATVALASLSAAAASIVGGALVSQQAVADTETPPEATVTVITSGSAGDAFSCTFGDLVLPAPVGIGGGAGTEGAVRVHGRLDATPASGSPTLTIEAQGVTVSGSAAQVTDGPGSPDDGPRVKVTRADGVATALDGIEVREGTTEECAAARQDLPHPDATMMATAGGMEPHTGTIGR
jgi:hypothetical protein